MSEPARVLIRRVVEWPDTDAAGHYHHSTVIRWVEAAESAMHLALGLPELFGVVPRVHYEVDYLTRLWFRDEVVVRLEVLDLGRTSVRYAFDVHRGDEPAARGVMVAVLIDQDSGSTVEWSPEARRLLLESGEVSGTGRGR